MYISADIAERIKFEAKRCNVSVKQMLTDIGLGANTMSNFKTSMPKADSLAKIADYLNCSVDYLLGRTDVPKGIVGDDYSEHEKKLIAAYRNKPEMQESIDKLLDISESKIHYVKVAARNGDGIKEIALTDEDIEAINNLPDVDDL